MSRSRDLRALSNDDHYRRTEPIGRPFDGSVPRFQPPPESNPYPYGSEPRMRRSVPSSVVRPLPPLPQPPVIPPEPFIAGLATAKNTDKIYRELKYIRWVMLVTLIAIGVMLFCEIEIAVRLSSILSFNAVS